MDAPISTPPAELIDRIVPGLRLGRYEVLSRVAAGGMATVYVARLQGVGGFERLFAIKVLHPHLAHEREFISMFLDEACLAAQIHHPNVVATMDVSRSDVAGYYLVMEYIEGDHFGALLQRAAERHVRLPVGVVLRVVFDTLTGLAAAHALRDENGEPLNLVHRDVSPHNVMVGVDGIARLADFGVAKAEHRISNTRDGHFKGKLAYMAPEQAANGNADQRTDLFAMGVILWEALVSKRLFRCDDPAATLRKICEEPIPMPSALDPELAALDSLLARALARNPNDRFPNALSFAEAIENLSQQFGGLASHRRVGQVVQTYAATKLALDAERIRGAVANLTTADNPRRSGARPTPAFLLALDQSRSGHRSEPPLSPTQPGRLPAAQLSPRLAPAEPQNLPVPHANWLSPTPVSITDASEVRAARRLRPLLLSVVLGGLLAAGLFVTHQLANSLSSAAPHPSNQTPTSTAPTPPLPTPSAVLPAQDGQGARPRPTADQVTAGLQIAPADHAPLLGLETGGSEAVLPSASTRPKATTEKAVPLPAAHMGPHAPAKHRATHRSRRTSSKSSERAKSAGATGSARNGQPSTGSHEDVLPNPYR